MNYRNSEWNDKNELKCLLILKKLQEENFLRGMQIYLSKEMEKNTKLTYGNISAKVSNFKSVAGINNSSNASKNTKIIYAKYHKLTISEIEYIINEMS